MPKTRHLLLLASVLIGPALSAPVQAAPAKPAGKPATPAKGSVTRAQLIAEVKQVFTRADTNHDGFMSRSEFAVRMGAVLNATPPGTPGAPTPAEAQNMLDAANRAFTAVDTNHDGKISLAEASARPLKVFDAMDTNHDGVVTLAEKAAAHQQAQASPVGPSVGDAPAGPGR